MGRATLRVKRDLDRLPEAKILNVVRIPLVSVESMLGAVGADVGHAVAAEFIAGG